MLLVCCSGASTTSGSAPEASIRLGDEARVRALYSYPNSCQPVVCYQDETLEQTVQRWLGASLERDGFDATATVRATGGIYYADITLTDPGNGGDLSLFVSRYDQFLAHGDTAVSLARSFLTDEHRWLPNWRFILPHGLAMTNNRTLEVMNFPPVSLVLQTQDYLDSNTTRRWKAMLGANGVDSTSLDLYSAILDIVPVAAPANEGYVLDDQKIYDGHFNGYAKGMLAMWTEVAGTTDSKPVIALGTEMRTWFNDFYAADFDSILDVRVIQVTPTRTAPAMYTHHPSGIFYQSSFDSAMAFMDTDAVASCWQAQMGMQPSSDPYEVKASCAKRWAGRAAEKCELLQMQICSQSPARAREACPAQSPQSWRDDWCPEHTG